MIPIKGGICSPKGFKANGIYAGFKKNNKKDLALIYCEDRAITAGTFTKNNFKAAPLKITEEHIKKGKIKAVLINSGVSNSCTINGMEKAKESCEILASELNINNEEIALTSTGTIGIELDTGIIKNNVKDLVDGLGDKSAEACEAIMTSDTFKKERAVSFLLDDVECRIGIIAKGSGMIEPNMATMLTFITTDVNISEELLQKALTEAVNDSFNMISVDRANSTNDTVLLMTSCKAKNKEIVKEEKNYKNFKDYLKILCIEIAKAIARDGNGATKLLEANITGAKTDKEARILAKSIISSNLVKASLRSRDAYWGRIFSAMAQNDIEIDHMKIKCEYQTEKGILPVYSKGKGLSFDEDFAEEVLSAEYILIKVELNEGNHRATAWGCDLTEEYVSLNGAYRKS